jgi:hypothetical protein
MIEKTAIRFLIGYIVLIIAGIIGWIMNVVNLFGLNAETQTTEFIWSLVGVFIPIIGAIYGWVTVF